MDVFYEFVIDSFHEVLDKQGLFQEISFYCF